MVGAADTIGGVSHAVLYRDGGAVDLGTLGGSHSSAYDISDAGQIVGISYIAGDTEQHAFLYSEGTMFDLSALPEVVGAGWSYLRDAQEINDVGQIVGTGVINGQFHAFLLTPVPEPSQ